MHITHDLIWEKLQHLKSTSPLVHNITNYVVMEQTANALLAIGASPIMAHAPEEMSDIVSISNSLVINIGTLSSHWITAMQQACKEATNKKIPIVLDPVGTGATSLRTKTALQFVENKQINALRGNASEIASLANNCFSTKGVDSTCSPEEILNIAKKTATDYKIIVSISGKNDYITNGEQTYKLSNGHELMSKVTGMGCTSTAILGAFLANSSDFLVSSVCAAAIMGLAGEIAAKNSNGPGSFKAAFLDALFNLNKSHLQKQLKLEKC